MKVKGQLKILRANSKQREKIHCSDILISDKTDFKTKKLLQETMKDVI